MTQIIPTVDFQQEGKQIGWLRVPHSVTRSAYGTLPLPIAVIRNGPGAQVMLSAGNHGDEYEGQIVLTRLIQQLQPEQIRDLANRPQTCQRFGMARQRRCKRSASVQPGNMLGTNAAVAAAQPAHRHVQPQASIDQIALANPASSMRVHEGHRPSTAAATRWRSGAG